MRAERLGEKASGKPKVALALSSPLTLTKVSCQIRAKASLKDTNEGQTLSVPNPSKLVGNVGSFLCEPIKPVRLRSQAFRQAKG